MAKQSTRPGTSDVRRRAIRDTDLLPGWPPAPRPAGLRLHRDPHRLAIAHQATRALALHVPPLWPGPYTAVAARAHLVRWTWTMGETIRDSSRQDVINDALSNAPEQLVPDMNTWLCGRWSTRPSLVQLLWRCDLNPCAISAALWLYDKGAA